ncbi:MAG TPA: hypothetical protein ENJ00_07760 [Phycisphaerales bacterium]|nr:hypothetical protein [Phycisphaerales bacterium]
MTGNDWVTDNRIRTSTPFAHAPAERAYPPSVSTRPSKPAAPAATPPTDPSRVRLLVLDVDGCLTDGSISIDHRGDETKRFNIKDGLGIVVWQRLGLHTAIITGRTSKALETRCRELGIDRLHQGIADKWATLRSILDELGIAPDETAAIGDDWNDLPVLTRIGMPMCPADAVDEVRATCSYVCDRPGGHGAVREAIDWLIESMGLTERALSFYRS